MERILYNTRNATTRKSTTSKTVHKQLANMEDSHVVNHAEPRTQQSPNTQIGSINASIDHDNFLTLPPRSDNEALRDINNQINDLRNIIGNQGQQVSERLENPQSIISSAVVNLQDRVNNHETQFGRLESKVNDFINDKDQGAMTDNIHQKPPYNPLTDIEFTIIATGVPYRVDETLDDLGVQDKECGQGGVVQGGWQQQQHHGYPSTPNHGSSSLSLQNRYNVLSDSSLDLQEHTISNSIGQTLASSGVNNSQETLQHENYGHNFPPIVENNDSVDSNSRDRRSHPGAIRSTMGWSSIPVSSTNSTSTQSTTQTTSSTSSHA